MEKGQTPNFVGSPPRLSPNLPAGCESCKKGIFFITCLCKCAVEVRWSRPPHKDFIRDFADFVSGVTLKYDHFLIVGDFNVHVCCETRPLVRDFFNLIDSLNLTQFSEPTHEKGHILDLVLSYGLNVQITAGSLQCI